MTKASSTVAVAAGVRVEHEGSGLKQAERLTQVVEGQSLYPGHVAEQLEQQAVQARVVVLVALDQVEQTGEGGLSLHHVKDGFIAAAVVEQDGRDNVQDGGMFLLQQTVDELAAHVVLVVDKERRVDQAVAAAGNVVLGVEEAVGRGIEEVAQTVVNLLVRRALRVEERVQALPERAVVLVVVGGSHVPAGCLQSPSRSNQAAIQDSSRCC